VKVHEHQAKEVFASFGIPVPRERVARSAAEAVDIADDLGYPVVIKAQVLVGGRGKAGGVKLVKDPESARKAATAILGMEIKGLPVHKVLVSEALDIAKEIYVGVILDRENKLPVVMASAAGGVEIEELAAKSPELIIKAHFDPLRGMLPYEARKLAFRMGLGPKVALAVGRIIEQLCRVYLHTDSSLAEINPLAVTGDGQVIALDAKLNVDDNALFRRTNFAKIRDEEERGSAEAMAREAGLSYVKLDGNVGCVVNGAGLAMATMDLVKHFGGEPANFLDIGGSSSPEKVIAAMQIITQDPNVKAILFNIFGGITRCDDVAKGIAAALKETGVSLPIVVRLTGTNEGPAREILAKVEGVTPAESMDGAVKQAIKLAGGRS
jgi:succinyl-CoA synthetase beta subunit